MRRLPLPLIQLRPRDDTLYVSQSRTVLATERDGSIDGGSEKGLLVDETRLLSRYRYFINGDRPAPIALSNVSQHSWLGYYICYPPGIRPLPADGGSGMMKDVSEQTLELRVSRFAGDGIHEDLDLTNFTLQTTSFRFEIEIDADFADQVETGGQRQQQGRREREWRQNARGEWELYFDYRCEHPYDHQGDRGTASIHRGITLRVQRAGSPPSLNGNRIGFDVRLEPGGTWHACIEQIPFIDGETLEPQYDCYAFRPQQNRFDNLRQLFFDECSRFSTPESETLAPAVIRALQQALGDLAGLRLYSLDRDARSWTVAAGLPIYVALFGRDTLTAAWQSHLATSGIARGTLSELARWQGANVDPWRDEEPGRMLHEAHAGPLEILNYNPRRRYYGSTTSSVFFPVAVGELWHWTGDKELIQPLIEPAMRCLEWLDRYGDLDGDGLYEYQTHSEQGVQNQGWKDSGDAIVYEDGSQVSAPISIADEHAFAHMAKLEMSEVLWWFDDREGSRRLFHEAMELKKRFNEVFWMEDEGYLAMGLDKDKRQIRSISSNAGLCMACGVIEKSFIGRIVDRVFSDELFSGWGFRTLSSQHPAFNPYSYHRGSVWPVENGAFAVALLRYGLADRVERIARAQFEAAALFPFSRLPEVMSGHRRDERHPFPALYPQANSPQAWSCSSVFCLMQALLGIYPYAPLHVLAVDPHLPEWLPEITVSNLHVGDAVASIHFSRKPDGSTGYRVQDIRGTLHVLRQPSPWSLTATVPERLKDVFSSLLPGR